MKDNWNKIESRYNTKFLKHDTILVSYPKAGRTWLRTILAHISSAKGYPPPKFEYLFCCHYNSQKVMELFGKDIKIVLLQRDIRDLIVSLFYEYKYRKKSYKGNISQFIRNENYGVRNVIDYYREWVRYFDTMSKSKTTTRPKYLVITYDLMLRNTVKQIEKLLFFIGEDIDNLIIDKAISDSNFDIMHDNERNGTSFIKGCKGNIGNIIPKRIEEFRVRYGVGGGYHDELSESDLEYITSESLIIN